LNEGKNFDSLLIEFGLPYNTIRRTNNPVVRLRSAISSFNTPMMLEAIKECDSKVLKTVLKNEIGKEGFYDILIRSIDGYMSFDYLNLLYDNGLTIHDIMPLDYMCDMIKNFAHNMKSISRATNTFTNMEGVTDEEVNDFYNFKIERREDAKYIGYYLAIKTIIENERLNSHETNELMKRFLSYMVGCGKQLDSFEQIVNLVKDKLDYSKKCDAMASLSKYTVYYGSEALKNFIYEKTITNSALKSFVDGHKVDFERWKERQNKQKAKVTISIEEPVMVTATVNGNARGLDHFGFIDDNLFPL
jgi:hypothetical protein